MSVSVSPAQAEVAPIAVLADPRAGKYLTFQLHHEEYAVPATKIREILGIQDITRVPDMPDYVRGVINLRGKAVPVIDLRRKFRLPPLDDSARTCIVIVNLTSENNSGLTIVGAVVDSVTEVLPVTAQDLEEVPEFGGAPASSYIMGLAKVGGRVKILLDIDKLMAASEGVPVGLPVA